MDEEKLQKYLQEVVDGDAFDVKETARRLNVSVWSVRGYIRDGVLEALKHGRGYVVPKSALYLYITQKVKAPKYELKEKIVPSFFSDQQKADYEAHATQQDEEDLALAQERKANDDGTRYDLDKILKDNGLEEEAPEPEDEEPEIVERDVAPEPPRRPRPTSFSDGFFG